MVYYINLNMFCCKRQNNNLCKEDESNISTPPLTPEINKLCNNDKILHEHLNRLIELNIKYNIEFNTITNEINKIKLSRENKEIFELDSVRKYTPIKIYSSISDEEIKIIKKRARGISAPAKLLTNKEKVSYV